MNYINYCFNKYFNNSEYNKNINNNNNNNSSSCNNKNGNNNKSSITINLRPDYFKDDSENNFINSFDSSNNNNCYDNEINQNMEYNCICNSGKNFELICKDCNQLLCSSCCNDLHLNHKLLKVEINSIVFQQLIKSNKNIWLLENAKSNYFKVEKLVIENHNSNKINISPKQQHQQQKQNKPNKQKIKTLFNENEKLVDKELDQYLEFIDLAIENVKLENNDNIISIKI